LTLFVAGATPRSAHARADVQRMCRRFLGPGQSQIEVVDVLVRPDLAVAHDVLLVPAVIRHDLVSRKVIGDSSDIERLARALAIPESPSSMSID